MPKFSIILATRDRPALFNAALESVLGQSCQDFQVIIVNDGSSSEFQADYARIYAKAREKIGNRLQVHSLVRRPKGHGQSYSINYGVDHSDGDFVCFLDDDDVWIDMTHLERLTSVLNNFPTLDVYMTNQRAYLREQYIQGPIWLEALEGELLTSGNQPDSTGSFVVNINELMKTKGFCHINCLIVRREHFKKINGMDEGIRWECDRDIFLRLVDSNGLMIHNPACVSHHNVPDPLKTQNMTTAASMLEKRLYQIRVLDKAILFSKHASISTHAREHKIFVLKKIAKELANNKKWKLAAFYAREAFGTKFGFKWSLFTVYCMLRQLH